MLPITPAGGSEVAATPPAQAAPSPVQQAAVQVVESEPAPEEVERLLEAQGADTTTAAAFAGLFALWNGEYDPAGGLACSQAAAQGLECVHQRGTCAQLRSVDRPALLSLIDASGAEHHVVVAGLGADTAHIRLADATHEVSISSLSRLWFGEYIVLWRPQVPGPRALSAGMQGPAGRWLRRSLHALEGHPADAAVSDYYDAELVRMVEDFQRRHRLAVDGVAGLQTQLLLDALNNTADAPLLIAQAPASTGTT